MFESLRIIAVRDEGKLPEADASSLTQHPLVLTEVNEIELGWIEPAKDEEEKNRSAIKNCRQDRPSKFGGAL